ncbi:MAG: hypothetical protein KJO75_21060 [Dactylosporangium sp.]|nr:hypothetical protein [Dactylosporangium sp.]
MLGSEQVFNALPDQVQARIAEIVRSSPRLAADRTSLMADQRATDSPLGDGGVWVSTALPSGVSPLSVQWATAGAAAFLSGATTLSIMQWMLHSTSESKWTYAAMYGALMLGLGPCKWVAAHVVAAAKLKRQHHGEIRTAEADAEQNAADSATFVHDGGTGPIVAVEVATADLASLNNEISGVRNRLDQQVRDRAAMGGSLAKNSTGTKTSVAADARSERTATGGDLGLTLSEHVTLAELRRLYERYVVVESTTNRWSRQRRRLAGDIRGLLDRLGPSVPEAGVEESGNPLPEDLRPVVERFGGRRRAWMRGPVKVFQDRYAAADRKPSGIAPWRAALVEAVAGVATGVAIAAVTAWKFGDPWVGSIRIWAAWGGAAIGSVINPWLDWRENRAAQRRQDWDRRRAESTDCLLDDVRTALSGLQRKISTEAQVLLDQLDQVARRMADLNAELRASQRRRTSHVEHSQQPRSETGDRTFTQQGGAPSGSTLSADTSEGSTLSDRDARRLDLLRELAAQHDTASAWGRRRIARRLTALLIELGLHGTTPGFEQIRVLLPADLRPVAERFGRLGRWSIVERGTARRSRLRAALLLTDTSVPAMGTKAVGGALGAASQFMGMLGVSALFSELSTSAPAATAGTKSPSPLDGMKQWMPQAVDKLIDAGQQVSAGQTSATFDNLLLTAGKVSAIRLGIEFVFSAARDLLAIGQQDSAAQRRAYAKLRHSVEGLTSAVDALVRDGDRSLLAQAEAFAAMSTEVRALAESVVALTAELQTQQRRTVLLGSHLASDRTSHQATAVSSAEGRPRPVRPSEVLDACTNRQNSAELVVAAGEVRRADRRSRRHALLELYALIDMLGLRRDMLGSEHAIAVLSEDAQRVIKDFGYPERVRAREMKLFLGGTKRADQRPAGMPGFGTYFVSSIVTAALTSVTVAIPAITRADQVAWIYGGVAAATMFSGGIVGYAVKHMKIGIDRCTERIKHRGEARARSKLLHGIVGHIEQQARKANHELGQLKQDLNTAEQVVTDLAEILAGTGDAVTGDNTGGEADPEPAAEMVPAQWDPVQGPAGAERAIAGSDRHLPDPLPRDLGLSVVGSDQGQEFVELLESYAETWLELRGSGWPWVRTAFEATEVAYRAGLFPAGSDSSGLGDRGQTSFPGVSAGVSAMLADLCGQADGLTVVEREVLRLAHGLAVTPPPAGQGNARSTAWGYAVARIAEMIEQPVARGEFVAGFCADLTPMRLSYLASAHPFLLDRLTGALPIGHQLVFQTNPVGDVVRSALVPAVGRVALGQPAPSMVDLDVGDGVVHLDRRSLAALAAKYPALLALIDADPQLAAKITREGGYVNQRGALDLTPHAVEALGLGIRGLLPSAAEQPVG